ncbi:S9 family peptidase [Cytobacillus sp. IB215316]|uniref:S9 family peptidase n=1 Tax=Cytobacillus sp. IB215316 TaxID=3097354 RepID=UPI002A0E2549|nr:S9 family peptidase [Cytobacillus sp. IB215316]MDX8363411.1 S9 family peptidase [Cytobacillus sp. IB215316]
MVTYKKPDVEQFLRAYTIQDFVLNNDESQLIFSTNISGNFNLWGLDLPNQFPYPLTFNDQSCQGLCYDKDGKFIIAAFDNNGDENSQLYMITPEGGQLNPIRTSEGHQHLVPTLSEDGNRLYYTSNKDDSTYLKSYCYHIDTGIEETLISGDDGPTYLFDVSPNEKSFLFLKLFSPTHMLAYVKINEELISLTPESSEQHTVTDVVYTSESDIYFITNCGEDFSYIAKFNIEDKEFSKVVSLQGEIFKMIKYDKKQHLLYIVSERGVEDQLYSFGIETAKLTELKSPVGVINKLEVTKQGNVYLVGTSATKPSNIYRKKINEQCWDKLTNNRILGMNEEQLVDPEVISYPSFDGMEIEALYFKANSSISNDHVILWPHGGPQYAERKNYDGVFQYLLSEGYSIFAPNFRGSTGYGLAFTKMVEGDWGKGPRLDNIEGLEFLFRNGLADREKVFLMGGSFGGYMSLLLHGRHPEYFKAIVDICGPSDLFSFIETVPEHWKQMVTQIVGHPEKDKEKLIEYSPITYLENMSKPMLVIQGANDPRVVKEESDQIVAILTEKGRDVEYIVLDDEGHGLTKKDNELKIYSAVNEFFTKHL